jgi:pSer/pThr/pTyr-binding forkhead associated (FHA) protein/ribosomal protein L40E
VRYCLDCGANLAPAPVDEGKVDGRISGEAHGGGKTPENVCATCATKNPLDARFCRECGALLGAGGEQPQSSDPQSPNPYTPAPYASHLLDVEAPPPPPQADLKDRRNVRPSQAQVHGETSKRCQRCSGHSAPTALFCQFCGASFENSPPPAARKAADPPSPRALEMPKAELVVIAQDGSPGRRYPVSGGDILIGSSEQAPVSLRRDPYVCPEHARIVYRNGGFFVEDIAPQNGVYVRIGGAVPLKSGDLLLLGLAVLCFDIMDESERHLSAAVKGGVRLFGTPPSPRYARLALQSVEGAPRDVYYLSRAETVLGREVGDIVFTDDPFMSRRHAAIRRDPNNNQFTLRDLGSSNGTFIAIRGRHAISHGDHIRVGQHLFRLDVRRGE